MTETKNTQHETITCAMCGHSITPEEGAAACKNCSLFGAGGCRMVRCPKCGYEMPPPARLPKLLSKAFRAMTKKKGPTL